MGGEFDLLRDDSITEMGRGQADLLGLRSQVPVLCGQAGKAFCHLPEVAGQSRRRALFGFVRGQERRVGRYRRLVQRLDGRAAFRQLLHPAVAVTDMKGIEFRTGRFERLGDSGVPRSGLPFGLPQATDLLRGIPGSPTYLGEPAQFATHAN